MSTPPIHLAPSATVGATALSAEVVEHVVDELPALAQLPERDRLMVATWLVGLRSPRTRRAYLGDARAWLTWLATRDVDVLDARRVHVDLWTSTQLAGGTAASTVRRRLAALSRFYEHLARHDLVEHQPVAGVVRPSVDEDDTDTIGLTREQARALLTAAEDDTGPQHLRTVAALKLLLHNGLRVDELCSSTVDSLAHDRGHRVLRIVGKGGRRAKIPLAPGTWSAVEDYLVARADRAGLTDWRDLDGPLLATRTGGPMHRSQLWELVQRLARVAEIDEWAQLAVHSLRHTAITLALDAGATLRDTQDFARHKDARTTRRYDRSRGSLDRSPTYALAAYLS